MEQGHEGEEGEKEVAVGHLFSATVARRLEDGGGGQGEGCARGFYGSGDVAPSRLFTEILNCTRFRIYNLICYLVFRFRPG